MTHELDFSRSWNLGDHCYTVERVRGQVSVHRQFLDGDKPAPGSEKENVPSDLIPDDLRGICQTLNAGDIPPNPVVNS